ncbi:hypothetical protein ABIE58_001252 [Roseovarius sp. MBR-78]|jgi:hypothetical protein|uniref:hypothetical protein n=1 Tax=Roseovarius sp. MBR-78 TaxID=3156460 RepID=UPI003391A07C
MLDHDRDVNGLRAVPAAPVPLAHLVEGRGVEEVAELVPRLFNLCREAQTVALRMALGLPVADHAALGAEIARDHALKLNVIWPLRLGLPARAGRGADVLGSAFPGDAEAFARYVQGEAGIGPLLRAVAARFGPGEGVCGVLPAVTPDSILAVTAQENSIAARHLDHPVMRHVEAQYGRGPLWRVVARAIDLEAAVHGRLPSPRLTAEGVAVVPAARGLYAVRAKVGQGRVIRLERMTPTDHLLAPGGIMAQALTSLPCARHALAGLMVDLLDPCTPVTLEGRAHA